MIDDGLSARYNNVCECFPQLWLTFSALKVKMNALPNPFQRN